MAEAHRLGPLQVGVAGHNGVLVGIRQVCKCLQHLFYKGSDLVTLSPQIHPQVQRHLVIPAAGGVQPLSRLPDTLGEHLFHKHVDVFRLLIHSQRAVLQVLQNARKPSNDAVSVLIGENMPGSEHGRMCHAPFDILPEHPFIKTDG